MAAGRDDRRARTPTDEVDDLRATLTNVLDLLHEQAEERAADAVRAEAARKAIDRLERIVLGIDGGDGISHRVTRNEGRLDTIEAREKDAGKALAEPRGTPASVPAHREPTEQQALVREREIDAVVGGWLIRTLRKEWRWIAAAAAIAGERIAHYLGLLDGH